MARNIPSYRKQKTKSGDRAFVELGGTRHYLGVYGSKESRQEYGRMIAEWTTNGGRLSINPNNITIIEVIASFWKFAEGYYANPNGDSTNELECYKQAFKPLVEIYGKTSAADFGPLNLKTVRRKMIDLGWCRSYINRQVFRVKRVFKWAASEELIDASIFHRLETVESLKKGRTDARESKRIEPVEASVVQATLPHLTPTMRAMVEVQRLTGMRPGEVCRLRLADMDMAGPVWLYEPKFHKAAYRGRSRRIFIGPKAQNVLRPFLGRGLTGYMFSPEQSERERRAAMREARVTPESCGNVPGSNKKRRPQRRPGERYKPDAYRAAIAYASLIPSYEPRPADLCGGLWRARWHREEGLRCGVG